MKKIFTLVFVSLFTIAAMANGRRPAISVVNNTYFKVMIDGRVIYNDYDGSVELRNIDFGRHTVTVLEERGGLFFGRRSRIISSSDFFIDDDDRRILIHVGQFGHISIDKAEFDRNRDRDDHDFDYRHGRGFNKRKDKGRSCDPDDHDDFDPHERGNGWHNKNF